MPKNNLLPRQWCIIKTTNRKLIRLDLNYEYYMVLDRNIIHLFTKKTA
jgi:hypothetical protein